MQGHGDVIQTLWESTECGQGIQAMYSRQSRSPGGADSSLTVGPWAELADTMLLHKPNTERTNVVSLSS